MASPSTLPTTDDLTTLLVREAARQFNAATTLAGRLDAIDFGRDQIAEANERADRITQRVMPQASAVNGLADPDGFIARSRYNYRRGVLRKGVYDRLLAKIVERDGIDIGEFK